MKKNIIKELLNDMLHSIGFKVRGNNWILKETQITKVINLQKSNFSNCYYINYGFIINDLPLTTKTHVDSRLSGKTKEEQQKITDLLDLENDISEGERIFELRKVITENVLSEVQNIFTTADLLIEILSRPTTNDIPLVVKDFYSIKSAEK